MRKCWLFQDNPERFDLEGFLNTRPPAFTWLVNRNADQVEVGDQAFIWRAIGKGPPSAAGIVAEVEVIEAPRLRREDTASLSFWRDPPKAETVKEQQRALVKLVRAAAPNDHLQRERLKADPILKDLSILKMPQHTVFRVTPIQAARLNALWRLKGGWSFEETVAAQEEEVQAHETQPLAKLQQLYEAGNYKALPAVTEAKARVFVRNALVAAIAKVRANHRCEVPACSHPSFALPDGKVFCEVHHVTPLAEGGEDTPENVVCLCPAHHREIHYGMHAAALRATLLELRRSGP